MLTLHPPPPLLPSWRQGEQPPLSRVFVSVWPGICLSCCWSTEYNHVKIHECPLSILTSIDILRLVPSVPLGRYHLMVVYGLNRRTEEYRKVSVVKEDPCKWSTGAVSWQIPTGCLSQVFQIDHHITVELGSGTHFQARSY